MFGPGVQGRYGRGMANVVHHIELWTCDIESATSSFGWLLSSIGWTAKHDPGWPTGRTWRHPSGVYIVLEQSSDITGAHERTRAGLNHLALRAGSLEQLDALREQSGKHGWTELFADDYPHAGGPQHTALFIENNEGLELELVTD